MCLCSRSGTRLLYLFRKRATNYLKGMYQSMVLKNLILEVGCSKKLSGSEEGIGQLIQKHRRVL
jgi:hypothetical protein